MSLEYKIPIPWERISYSVIALISLILLYTLQVSPEFRIGIYLIGGIIGSQYFLKSSINHILNKHKITTDVIMTLAVIGAAILGEFEESLTIVFLYSITETLESYTVRRTKYSIKSLIKLVPKEVTRLVGEKEEKLPIDEIKVTDIIKINVGDIFPTDGTITKGTAMIDESTITGEPIPKFKNKNDQVFAGTSCSDGTVVYTVTKLPSESTVQKIIDLVEDAQSKKVPVQLTIERFTKYYNPGILIFSFLVFLIPAFITSEIQVWAILAVTLLVASSPCALAISSPVTMYSAISTTASRGILVKGGVHLEELGRIEAIVFDKTGTLTYGKPVLTDIIPTLDVESDKLLQIAGTLELNSNHPLARAVVDKMREEKISKLETNDHSTEVGVGVTGIIDKTKYFIGKFDYEKDDNNLKTIVEDLTSKSKTISYITREDTTIGILAFTDQVRDSAITAIQELHTKQIPIFMLTGDNKESAQNIGKKLGIDQNNIFYSMKPEDKLDKIRELKNQYKLAMVGDGINDAPALALAHVGIAMGAAGTDVALESADIAIMSDDLPQFVKSIEIGKQMKSIIMQNIIISTAILSGLLIGVLLGLVNITQAILIHEGTEVLIVANAMKLFRHRSF